MNGHVCKKEKPAQHVEKNQPESSCCFCCCCVPCRLMPWTISSAVSFMCKLQRSRKPEDLRIHVDEERDSREVADLTEEQHQTLAQELETTADSPRTRTWESPVRAELIDERVVPAGVALYGEVDPHAIKRLTARF